LDPSVIIETLHGPTKMNPLSRSLPARFLLPVLAAVLSACGETAAPAHTALPPSAEPQTTPAAAPTNSLPATDVVGPAITPTIPPSAPMPGLVYTTLVQNRGMMGPWIVERDGRGKQLGNKPDPVLSPDRGLVVFTQDGDIWLMDLLTGVEKNITNTYDIVEDYCQWWPARPGLIVFHYKPRGDDSEAAGYLARIKSDGSNYYILDGQTASVSQAALSPDGQSIAYDRDGQPWIFTFGEGRKPILPQSFPETFGIAADPEWSPDSRRIAWQLYGLSDGAGESSATAILDLDTMTVSLFHRHPLAAGSDTSGDHLAWSPDGEWLAMANPAERTDDGQPTLWILSTDGGEEFRIGAGDFPVWSPDGATLIYQAQTGVLAVKPGNWLPFPVTLPHTARVIDWVTF
jgi:hypothetical protein